MYMTGIPAIKNVETLGQAHKSKYFIWVNRTDFGKELLERTKRDGQKRGKVKRKWEKLNGTKVTVN